MKQHVLVVFPHPDDEAFGVAGTIMAHTDAGVPVTYVCLTLGEMGRNMGRPLIANRETLPEIRKQELKKACEVLGVTDLRMFGMRDKTVEFTDQEVLINRLLEVINEIEPSLVITFYPGYAVHPDHDATGAAVIQAIKRLPQGERPTLYALAFSKGAEDILGPPDVEISIDKFAERKIKVLEAHESQTAGFVKGMKQRYEEKDEAVVKQLTLERFWTYPIDE
ncbi:bacillithiol biosynthesis deacetylase BshB2 [Evansella vedderi]|uniref:Bacillithiol biosynthesis deacetylase BshB2 n=1 Tax=Evansella vedderi TaxID=38282 RepID=A0ABU0A2U6_9BACI|nr:bacillithiol biosynthesis deacetylase BshB2 [Evansella vedderi]MDQ0257424.1 bacillithiol biosynthesis deacetylase BshB2 [Evansella vedderi]